MSSGITTFVIVFSVMLTACQGGTVAKRSVESIPIESVDAETNGERAGETHFNLGSNQLFFSYEKFDTTDKPIFKVQEKQANAIRTIESGDITNRAGAPEGAYAFLENDSKYSNEKFCLHWARDNRYAQVCSESEEGIKQFRNEYEL